MSKILLEIHIVTDIIGPLRLQEYGVAIFEVIKTKSALKKTIKKNLILVNGTIATTATLLKNQDKIELFSVSEKTTQKIVALKLEVIFEDDFLAIINKPPGILVSGNKFKTIDNALVQNLLPSNQLDATRPRPVHRLDYPTTGLLLIGKTVTSIIALNKMFKEKEISKTYYAITIRKMNPSGTIVNPIDSKEASTYYELESSVNSQRFESLNLVKLYPRTGRKHQLRIHVASLGNPILGDPVYGIENLILKGKGLFLHAHSLEFIHPFTKRKLFITKECPNKFQNIFPNDSCF
jgi:23S rRNA pseudouridine1911/1915/1917 synthase